MKWGIVSKPQIRHVLDETRKLVELLAERGQDVLLEEHLAKEFGQEGFPLGAMDADVFATVGGDGTILRTLGHTQKPVLGINAGGVGFLTEVEPKYVSSAVDRVLAKDFVLEERTRLSGRVGKQQLPDAINEVTVQTAKIAKLIKFRLSVDGQVVDTFRGDGLIVSTSTGSTGYSMSVGGPILHPRVQGTVLSPIAPFRLSARPLVIPYDSEVRVTLLERRSVGDDKGAKAVVDGQHGFGLDYNATVVIGPSERMSRFIRFGQNFYGRVRTKLIR